jgi:hypothetical protein
MALAQLDFVKRAEMVHFFGAPGTGKSHLATGRRPETQVADPITDEIETTRNPFLEGLGASVRHDHALLEHRRLHQLVHMGAHGLDIGLLLGVGRLDGQGVAALGAPLKDDRWCGLELQHFGFDGLDVLALGLELGGQGQRILENRAGWEAPGNQVVS